ncbi:hypothetical protein L4D06_25280 [Enterovibrio makurazakiensis]|uniref:hypothetical protein n=1 Tax=Enterovibrio makurazakiensis TaxID=2910232 RepID=UPI003D20BFD0
MWGNDLFAYLFDNLEEAYKSGEQYIAQKAQDAYDSTIGALEWIWEALQGDFNANQTTGQIAANAALGIIPIVDQVLDCRDLIANCRNIHKDKSDVNAWIALCFTLIGLIPSLGSIAKGVLKILFLFIRKMGGDVSKAIRPAMAPIISFLQNEKVRKIFDVPRIDIALKKIAEAIKSVGSQVNAATLKGYLDKIVSALTDTVAQIRYFAPASVKVWLDESVRLVRSVQKSADSMLEPAIAPVKKLLDDIEQALLKQADEYSPSYRTDVNARTVHELDPSVATINPRILTRTQKGLYGEIISDNHMLNSGHRNMLPESRQVRSLEDTPRGRGIDGIYEKPPNALPPPYIITETKYRTDSGKYIDSDGLAKDRSLSRLRDGTKQMSDDWIQPRLAAEVGRDTTDDIMDEGYERWLMIVDESGEVVNITRLDANARSIEEVTR